MTGMSLPTNFYSACGINAWLKASGDVGVMLLCDGSCCGWMRARDSIVDWKINKVVVTPTP